MKKILCALIVCMLICAAAMAEMPGFFCPESAVPFGIDQQISIDLDGDDQEESLVLRLEGVEFEENLGLYVFGVDGDVYPCKMPASVFIGAYVSDIDANGKAEIFVCGDMYSDDYYTWCLNYTADVGLSPVPFDGMDRGYLSDESADMGYGMITAADGASITLTGSQDILGTQMMDRSFTLKDGRFQMDDGLFVTHNPDWEYHNLVAAKEIPAMIEGKEGSILPGEEIVVTAGDLQSIVHFEMKDGRSGSLAVSLNDEYGWGFFIDGVPEDECFEWIPYAD